MTLYNIVIRNYLNFHRQDNLDIIQIHVGYINYKF